MSDLVQLWKKMSLKLFFPEEKRNLFWLLIGPILLLCSALVLLSNFAPLQTLLLSMGVFLLLASYLAPKKIAQFSLGLTLLFAIFCLRGKTSSVSLTEFFWTMQYLLALFVAQQTIFASKEYSITSSTLRHDLEEDGLLWRSRFETLREKIDSDREVWEAEIEDSRVKAEEKNAYAESLRRLMQTAHAQIRKLEERPQVDDEYDQMAHLKEKRSLLISTIDHIASLKVKDQRIQSLQMQLDESGSDSSVIEEKDQLIQSLQIQLDESECDSSDIVEKDQQILMLEDLLKVAEENKVSASEVKEKDEKIEELEELLQVVDGESATIVIEGKEIDQEGVLRMLKQLNEAREQNYQLELLLSNAKEKYEELENTFEVRRSRNQDLLTTTKDKPITLQSLSRKANNR